jgi:hypothetical protein
VKIIESNSGWRFKDLLRKTAVILNDNYGKYTKPIEIIEDRLMEFVKKLPNGDYDKIIKEYWK